MNFHLGYSGIVSSEGWYLASRERDSLRALGKEGRTMCMTIDSENNVKVMTLDTAVTTVRFEAKVDDLRQAGILFREAVGQVKSLNDSLLGAHPTCVAALGIDQERHVEVRKFRDEEGLWIFWDYIRGLTNKVFEVLQDGAFLPVIETMYDSEAAYTDEEKVGFGYATASGRAAIALRYSAAYCEWCVSGFAKLLNPAIVERNLKKKGFAVTLEKQS